MIGSGWLFGALRAAQMAGPAAIISWSLASVLVLLIGLVYAELGAMFPVSGGVIRYPHWAFGGLASFSMGWVTWLAAATVAPIEVEGALQYASHYVTWFTHEVNGTVVLTTPGYGMALVGMAVFCVINMIGIRAFARINNVLVWWKLGVIVLVVAMFVTTAFHSDNLTAGSFAPTGTTGVLAAIPAAGIIFSFLGFRQAIELAGESANPKRNVPVAVIASVLIVMLIYVGLQVAFLGAIEPADLAGGWGALSFEGDAGPLAALAGLLGLGWLSVLLYVDAVVSPADTGLIYTTSTSRLSYAMARNDTAPAGLARTSPRGVPWQGVVLAFVVGVVIFMPFPGWQKLVGFITSATVLSFGSGPLVLAALRRQLPDQPRPFRVPGGHVIPFLAFYSSNLVVFWAGWDVNWKLFVAILLGFGLFAAYQMTRTERPELDWKAGSWVAPWLVGLALVSWLGEYSSDGLPHGQVGLIGTGMGFAVMAALSAVIYPLALRVRLAPERVRELLTAGPPARVAVGTDIDEGPGLGEEPAT